MNKPEEVRNRNQEIDLGAQKPPSEFSIFCEQNKYVYRKFFPHLNSLERTSQLRKDFDRLKAMEQDSQRV